MNLILISLFILISQVSCKLLNKRTISLRNVTPSQKAAVDINKLCGCWEVIETGGRTPSWQKYSAILGKFNKNNNRNFQIFDKNGNFNNLSEYFGKRFFAYTDGTYETIDKKSGVIAASVSSIYLVLFSLKVRINVNGKGVIQVKYLDSNLRVFESEEKALVLQEKIELPDEYAMYLVR